jgi:hypothetical protein
MQIASALKVSVRKSSPLTMSSSAWKSYSPPYLKVSWCLSLEALAGGNCISWLLAKQLVINVDQEIKVTQFFLSQEIFTKNNLFQKKVGNNVRCKVADKQTERKRKGLNGLWI